jgi:RND family efflux transporter MFP subunit
VLVAGIVLLLTCAAGVLWLHHRRNRRVSEQRRHQQDVVERGPRIFVAPVTASPPVREVTLPSDVRAFYQSTLYAKVPGYLASIPVDKGDEVREGDLLARIESPETDQNVANARATAINAERFSRRKKQLVKQRFVAQQDYETARAEALSAEAQLQMEIALQAYETIRAPFSGTVTGRYVDPGALLPAGTASTLGAQPIVDLADLSHLRIAVFVGQDVAPFVNELTTATISQDERPDLKIDATLTRTSGALDPRSRTMLCEIWLDNSRYHLQPGTFVHVTLHVKVPPSPTVPSEALFLRNNTTMAAVVRDDEVHFVQVQPGIDDGTRAQVRTGLSVGETVALNVPADLADGTRIQPVPRPAPKPLGRR